MQSMDCKSLFLIIFLRRCDNSETTKPMSSSHRADRRQGSKEQSTHKKWGQWKATKRTTSKLKMFIKCDPKMLWYELVYWFWCSPLVNQCDEWEENSLARSENKDVSSWRWDLWLISAQLPTVRSVHWISLKQACMWIPWLKSYLVSCLMSS